MELSFCRQRLLSLFAASSALFLCACLSPAARGQNPAPVAAPSDIHIGVIECYEPVRLSARNVNASIAGQTYAVAITPRTTQVPTHLLVILEPGPKNTAPYSDAMETVGRVFARGWLVSIVRPDGYATPYTANQAALTAALQSIAPPAFDYGGAFNELASFAGRRVLILEQSVSATNPRMLATARSLIPETYRVDGGVIVRDEPFDDNFNLVNPGIDYADGYAETPAASIQPQSPRRKKIRSPNGVMHEVKFANAVKDALSDANYYYDLDVKVPASALAGPVLLTYRNLHPHTDLFSETPYQNATGSGDGPKREPLQVAYSIRRQ
jgi:hypothetical protein